MVRPRAPTIAVLVAAAAVASCSFHRHHATAYVPAGDSVSHHHCTGLGFIFEQEFRLADGVWLQVGQHQATETMEASPERLSVTLLVKEGHTVIIGEGPVTQAIAQEVHSRPLTAFTYPGCDDTGCGSRVVEQNGAVTLVGASDWGAPVDRMFDTKQSARTFRAAATLVSTEAPEFTITLPMMEVDGDPARVPPITFRKRELTVTGGNCSY